MKPLLKNTNEDLKLTASKSHPIPKAIFIQMEQEVMISAHKKAPDISLTPSSGLQYHELNFNPL